MVESGVIETIGESISGLDPAGVSFLGEGDFCRAYSVGDEWIFRFAYNAEGSRSLELESRLLPALAPSVHMPIPRIVYSGRAQASGLGYVGYPKLGGAELTRERLYSLAPTVQDLCAVDLAACLRDLHSFGREQALLLGVAECGYPFCRTETGIVMGAAEDLYAGQLARLLSFPELDGEVGGFCEELCRSLIEDSRHPVLPPALVHGDLSSEHVLFDASSQRLTGVIDFTDVLVTTPLLDFVYLYSSYGEPFLSRVLAVYLGDATSLSTVMAAILRLHAWYTAIRLLWALDNDYHEGIEARLHRLRDLALSVGTGTS